MEHGDSHLWDVSNGQSIDLVCSREGEADRRLEFPGEWHNEVSLVEGWRWGLTPDQTVYGLCRTHHVEGLPFYQVDDATRIAPNPSASENTLVDACSGLGGMSLGAQAVSIAACPFVDMSALACNAHALNKGLALQDYVLSRSSQLLSCRATPCIPSPEVRDAVKASPAPVALFLITEADCVEVQVPHGTTVAQLTAAADAVGLPVRDALSQIVLGPDQQLAHGQSLDVRMRRRHVPDGITVDDGAAFVVVAKLVQDALPGWFTLPPSVASCLVTAHKSSVDVSRLGQIFPKDMHSFVGVFEARGHWACLSLQQTQAGTVEGFYFDGTSFALLPYARDLAAAICQSWGKQLSSLVCQQWFAQAFGLSCGTIAVAHAASVVGAQHDRSIQALRRLQDDLQVHAFEFCLHTGRGELSASDAASLAALLVSKGVPADKAGGRVTELAKKIGATAIVQALQAKNPWQCLKAAASRPGSIFRLVAPDELEAKVREKAAETFGAVVPQGRRKKLKQAVAKKSGSDLVVDPQSLLLTEGSFITPDGEGVHQIGFEEVTNEAHGLAFCTAEQALPFLQGELLSTDPLCLVTTAEVPPVVKACREHVAIRYPVIYQPTKEAMLLSGSLINLGDEPISLAQGTIAEPASLATGVVRVSVFRDEFAGDWVRFVAGPVKWMINTIPALRVCPGVDCGLDCPAFHPAVEEKVDQLILDLWARQYQLHDGKRADPQAADVFSVLMRVPKSAIDQLQLVQQTGVYVEPRADAGAGSDDGYRVVWIPGANKDHAKHVVKTCTKALAVTRLGLKYGVRVRECDEESVFATIRPGVTFIKTKVSMRFRIHPLPHGTQRSDLIGLLRGWGWQARPLQPGRGDSAGAAWLVGADSEPPSLALTTGDGFALVTQLGSPPDRAGNERQLYATQKTRQHIRLDKFETDARGEDPWTKTADPWAQYKAPVVPAPSKSTAGQTRLSALESSLRQSALDTAQKHAETAAHSHAAKLHQATEARFEKLETNIREMQQQHVKFTDWVQSINQQVSQTASEISEVQMNLSSQAAAIQNVRVEVQQQAEGTQAAIQSTVQQSFQAMQASFSQQLSAQFEQFQSLLAKRKHPE